MTYLVIGICLVLLLAVVFISAKPIGMGIEARRKIHHDLSDDQFKNNEKIDINNEKLNDANIINEIEKLNQLRIDGVLSDDEFKKAKNKLLD